MKKYLFAALMSGIIHLSYSQSNNSVSFEQALDIIKGKYDIEIQLLTSEVEFGDYRGSLEANSLGETLRSFTAQYGLIFLQLDEGKVYLLPESIISETYASEAGVNLSLDERENNQMANAAMESFRQTGKIRITLSIIDGKTRESLPGSIIFNERTGESLAGGMEGKAEFQSTVGNNIIKVQVNGFETSELNFRINRDTTIQVEMFEKSLLIDEVVISDNTLDDKLSSNFSSVESLSITELEKQPALLGEVDIIKSLTTVAGVSSAGEGAGGFNVRGGSIDQNLVLYDNAPVFYTSHLFGLFSIFNSEAINNVNLYKGGIPAQYGGRLSSVLQVNAKRGDYANSTFGGSVGTISSKLYYDGPVGENNSLALGGRIAYPNYLFGLVQNDDLRQSSAQFSDANIKFNRRLSDNENLDVTGYLSNDSFSFDQDTTYQWSNVLLSANYSRLNENGGVMNIGLAHSQFNNAILNSAESNNYRYDGFIKYTGINFSNSKEINRFDVTWGLSTASYSVNLGEINPETENSSINPIETGEEAGLESGIFTDLTYDISSQLTLSGGVRVSTFINYGEQEVFNYESGVEKRISNISDTLSYQFSDLRNFYYGVEPRLNINYKVDATSSIKAGFNIMTQYIHLISNTAAAAPQDVWKLSGTHVQPQRSFQLNLGYFKEYENFDFGVETYYKRLWSLVEFKDGARLILNPAIETALTTASGHTYGAEFNFSGKKDELSYQLNYTFSQSIRRTASEIDDEIVNNNEYYAAQFNRPHDLFFNLSYQLSKRVQLGVNFVYTSGRPITFPSSAYTYDGVLVANFSERNQASIPDYHRADVSLFIDENLRKNKNFSGQWKISLYNLYGRRNPYSVFFEPVGNGRLPQAYRLSVLGSILPSVSYSFKFN